MPRSAHNCTTSYSCRRTRRWTSATTLGSTKDSRRGARSQWRLNGDVSAELSSFELVCDNEVQSRTPVDERWRSRARESTSTPAPMPLGATSKGKDKGERPPPQSPQTETQQPSKPKAKAKSLTAPEKECFCCKNKWRVNEGCNGGKAATGGGAGKSASGSITPQQGALPRIEKSMSMSSLLATPLNDDAWTRTHRKGHIDLSDLGSTAPWLRLYSLPGSQRRVMIDNCAGTSVFPTMCDLSDSLET